MFLHPTSLIQSLAATIKCACGVCAVTRRHCVRCTLRAPCSPPPVATLARPPGAMQRPKTASNALSMQSRLSDAADQACRRVHHGLHVVRLARLHPRALLQPVPPVADRLVGAGREPRRHRTPARPELAHGGDDHLVLLGRPAHPLPRPIAALLVPGPVVAGAAPNRARRHRPTPRGAGAAASRLLATTRAPCARRRRGRRPLHPWPPGRRRLRLLVLLAQPLPAVAHRVVRPARQVRRDEAPAHAHPLDASADGGVLFHRPRLSVHGHRLCAASCQRAGLRLGVHEPARRRRRRC
mmetsp:Transcript_36310/g.116978  ORF Transcript_36310/g.116978 Transcript_36310/m.116978 type:complete len:296 (+) Transcript_36310:207-1094(+)